MGSSSSGFDSAEQRLIISRRVRIHAAKDIHISPGSLNGKVSAGADERLENAIKQCPKIER